MDMTTDSLTIQEAAEKLGVSIKTIRRRIEKGSLQAYKVETKRGYEWRVVLPGSMDNDGQSDGQINGHDQLNDHGQPDQDTAVKLILMETLLDERNRVISKMEAHINDLQAQLSNKDRQIEGYMIAISRQAEALKALPSTQQNDNDIIEAETIPEAEDPDENLIKPYIENLTKLDIETKNKRPWWKIW